MGARIFTQHESHRRRSFTTSGLLSKFEGRKYHEKFVSHLRHLFNSPPPSWGKAFSSQNESRRSRRFSVSDLYILIYFLLGNVQKMWPLPRVNTVALTPALIWGQNHQNVANRQNVVEGDVFRFPALWAKLKRRKNHVNRGALLPAGCDAARGGWLRRAADADAGGGWWRRSAVGRTEGCTVGCSEPRSAARLSSVYTDRDTTVVGAVAHVRHYYLFI